MSDSKMKTHDISSEVWREYRYPTASGKLIVYRIEEPVDLYIREGGTGHRVVDAKGVSHWVPVNKLHMIAWESRDKPVHF